MQDVRFLCKSHYVLVQPWHDNKRWSLHCEEDDIKFFSLCEKLPLGLEPYVHLCDEQTFMKVKSSVCGVWGEGSAPPRDNMVSNLETIPFLKPVPLEITRSGGEWVARIKGVLAVTGPTPKRALSWLVQTMQVCINRLVQAYSPTLSKQERGLKQALLAVVDLDEFFPPPFYWIWGTCQNGHFSPNTDWPIDPIPLPEPYSALEGPSLVKIANGEIKSVEILAYPLAPGGVTWG